MISRPSEIIHLSKEFKVVGIDELQFFDRSIVKVCKTLAYKKKRVIAAGLDTDYFGQPFGPMPEMMCEADYLDKLRAICVLCGNPASYTQRTTCDKAQVVLGELDNMKQGVEVVFNFLKKYNSNVYRFYRTIFSTNDCVCSFQ